MHCAVHGKLKLNKQTSGENIATNLWEKLLSIEKWRGWVKGSIRAIAKFK